MSSSIFFRFKSQKEPLQITFDGPSLSVFEVKREIIAISKLGDGTDFDLEIYRPDSMEKYDDDTETINRSETVVARRLPASRAGAGRAARYVSGKMPTQAKNQHRIESTLAAANKGTPLSNGTIGGGKEMTEEEKLNAMFAANTEAWRQDQAASAGKPVIRSNYNKAASVPDKPLPPNYTCHRCGSRGHWIQACPTNTDPTFDGRPKFRRTTGIPKSMLKKVPDEWLGEDNKPDLSKIPDDISVMYTADNEWVQSMTDEAAWQKFQERTKAAAEMSKDAIAVNEDLRKRGLECSIDNKAFVDPVKTPCCNKSYCRDCIENALLDGDLQCPNCGEQVLLDKLEPDDEMSMKLKGYEDEKKQAAKDKLQKEKEAPKSPAAASTPKVENAKSPAPTVSETKVEESGSASSTPKSKKRGATEELENNRKPAAPSEMKKTSSQQGTPIPTGPKAATPQQPPPMQMPNNMQDFVKQMQSMAPIIPGMQNGMNAMMNPMMGMGMPMMGMNGMNPVMNPMMGMAMGGFNGMNGMNGMGNMGTYGGGMANGGNLGGQQQGWNGNQSGDGGGQGGAYMRQPVNPHRHQGRQRRQRSIDYKQMGSG